MTAETATPVENLTLWQRVYTHLRSEILSGALPPGSELQEVALSASLGVSRGPIREAIGRLAAEGLVTVRPRRGAIVRALSTDEFLEAYQVREALEVMAVRLAVPRLTPEDLAVLEEHVDEMTSCAERGDTQGFFEANTGFHRAFFDMSGNRMLRRSLPEAARPDRPPPAALARTARQRPALDRRAQGDPARGPSR